MSELKLYGMKTAYDESWRPVSSDSTSRRTSLAIFCSRSQRKTGALDQISDLDHQASLAKDLDDFQFAGTPINERLVRDSPKATFSTSSATASGRRHRYGKTHVPSPSLAIAFARQRGCFTTPSISSIGSRPKREADGRTDRGISHPERLRLLDELGYLPSPRPVVSCCSI